MKILLIQAGLGSENYDKLSIDQGLADFLQPPLGLCYIGALLKEKGHQVTGIDLFFINSNTELELELQKSPDVIGISFSTDKYKSTKDIINKCRAISPQSFIILGGYHVSFDIDNSMNDLQPDAIIPFEGELATIDLIDALKNKKNIDIVRGVKTKTNQLICADHVVNLDSLPIPDRDIFAMKRYFDLADTLNKPKCFSIIGTRGCPYNCIFCVASAMRKYLPLRMRTVDNILTEIDYISHKYDVYNFYFAEELFMQNKERMYEFCNKLKKLGTYHWSCEGRVNVIDEETISLMKEAGCISIQIGIESGDNQTLKDIKKGISTEQIINAAKICQKYKLEVYGVIVFGLPTDTLETFEYKYEFTELLSSLGVQVRYSIMTPFPGTEIYEKREQFGVNIHNYDWDNYVFDKCNISTKSLSQEQIEKGAQQMRVILRRQNRNRWLKNICR